MSNYLVDGSDLTSVADAIRAKSGGSSDLAFPAGFVSAVDAIPTGGGGYTIDDLADGSMIPDDVVLTTATSIRKYGFAGAGIKTLRSLSALSVYDSAIYECNKITNIFLPNATAGGSYAFTNNAMLETLVLGNTGSKGWLFRNNPKLAAVDLGNGELANQSFFGDKLLTTIILRRTAIQSLGSTNVFTTNTPFANGGSGGTIYIPKVLYDHLGDGTALDYKAATNWSTIDGYGTITWAQIEGSQYETTYADGTPIAS